MTRRRGRRVSVPVANMGPLAALATGRHVAGVKDTGTASILARKAKETKAFFYAQDKTNGRAVIVRQTAKPPELVRTTKKRAIFRFFS